MAPDQAAFHRRHKVCNAIAYRRCIADRRGSSVGCRPHLLTVLLLLSAVLLGAREGPAVLKAPGLRLKQDPSIVIPADYFYVNRTLTLPTYRDPDGQPADGWSRKYIATRRFHSNQSAWIYYRRQDLRNAVTLNRDQPDNGLCIWPGGSLIVIESYQGAATAGPARAPVEIDVVSKAAHNSVSYGNAFLASEWSYTRFTSQGKRSISSAKVHECHQCHGIAFQLTGDLVFTRFP